jgi:hypothetical protein
MTIEKSTTLYEVLVRFDETGAVKGGHVIDMETVKDTNTDEILSARETAARPITEAEVGDVIGASNAQNIEQIAQLEAERDAAVADKEAVETDKAEAVAAIEAERDSALAKIAELEAQLSPLDTQGFAVLRPVQVRLALLGAGVTSDQVDAVISAIPDAIERETARTYWEYAEQVHRDHPLIGSLGAALGLSGDEIDALWAQAAQIN